MGNRLSNSFALVKASAHVLRLDKELMLFPVMSGISTILVCATFVAPIAATGAWELFTADGQGGYVPLSIMFGFYVVLYAVIFFFNAALVGAALIRLDGGDPTVGDGLAIASKRIGSILGYAVIAATVGMILRMIAERSGFLGKLVAGLFGMAWTLATYLAVPVLVTKDIGPLDAVKESAMVFKRTWGEQVVGNFGMGWAIFLMVLGWTAVSGLALYVAANLVPVAIIPAVGVAVLGYILLGLFGSALNGVYTAALYRYAMTGEVANFDPSIMGNAFRAK
jgi:hypothetical protein